MAITITFDPAKRAVILKERGIDLLDAAKVFAGATATWVDDRFDYGETRYLTAGLLANRMVLIAWTQRGSSRRVISMRYCHAKEVRKFKRRFPEAFADQAGQ
jgi:uncharacterized DUF497 family protein